MNRELIKFLLKEIATGHAKGVITKIHGKGPAEPVSLEGEDFSNLNITNITPDEAFSTGCSVCGDTKGSCGHQHAFEREAEFYVENPEALSDWVGVRRHSMAPHEESYRKVGDILIMNPEMAHKIIQPLLDSTGATCPISAAKAITDILEVLSSEDIGSI